jgi:hypothetical protein
VVCSPFPDSADYYAIMGYVGTKASGVIQIHSPDHLTVAEKRKLLDQTLGREGLKIEDWKYPAPEDDERGSWQQAWLLAQLQALERVDAVVAIGGKVSNTANTLLHLAEARSLPIVPFAFLGGAARKAFERRDWKSLNPDLNTAVLEKDDGIDQTIEVVNHLMIDRVTRTYGSQRKPKRIFLSFANQDKAAANALGASLKDRDIEVLIGDDQIRANQMISASIQQALLKSDICVVLWSRHYALSPWCFDELSLAINQQSYDRMKIWLLKLDDSAIVPASARALVPISVESLGEIDTLVDDLLSRS